MQGVENSLNGSLVESGNMPNTGTKLETNHPAHPAHARNVLEKRDKLVNTTVHVTEPHKVQVQVSYADIVKRN